MLPLTSVRLLVLIGLLAVACVVLTLRSLRLRRTRRPWLVLTGGGAAFLLLVTAGAAAGVNRHFGLFRSWSSLFGLHSRDLVRADGAPALNRALAPLPAGVAERTHGQLLDLRIPGDLSGLPVSGSLVYLPPQYGSAAYALKGFPVVEAIPGSPGSPVDYINGMQADEQLDRAIATGALPPVIVVFPPSNVSRLRSLECVDTADGLRDETYLAVDVRAWVTAHLTTDHQRWTALGYSTGGYCALDLSFRHPDLYGKAVSLDGYAHALDDNYARGLWGYGDAGRQNRLEHSPDWWVAHHPPEAVDVYLSAGLRDAEAGAAAAAFWRQLEESGWRHPQDRLVVADHGRHTFFAWAAAFVPSLQWALRGAQGDDLTALARLRYALAHPCAPSPGLSPSPSPGALGSPSSSGTTSAAPEATSAAPGEPGCGRRRPRTYHRRSSPGATPAPTSGTTQRSAAPVPTRTP